MSTPNGYLGCLGVPREGNEPPLSGHTAARNSPSICEPKLPITGFGYEGGAEVPIMPLAHMELKLESG